MNKIVNKKTDFKNQQRSNYHQQSNVKSREGSSSVKKRRRQISSIFTNSSTSKNSRSRSPSKNNNNKSNSRQSSINKLKSVKGRKPTPIPPKKQQGQQPCKFWMEGRCKNFEQCKFRHYQMTQILFKQNKTQNKIELINQEQHNNNKILVKIEQTSLMTQEQLMQTALRAPEGISMAIKISYKNKKATNKIKNKLNKNQKDPFTNNEQKKAQEVEILNELLTNTQTDNKNKNAVMIKEKIEKIKKEQSERAQILKNKPKIIINKEAEENQVLNQQSNQNQQYQDNNTLIQISDEQSDEEIDMTNYNFNYKKNSNNITNKNNTQTNYQLNNLNQSQINIEQQQKTPTQQININQFEYSLSQDPKKNEGTNLPHTMPYTLVSPTTYIEKDKQKDIQQNNQKELKKLFGEEIQNDIKWSQNIRSLYQQWKQNRDGKDHSNIHSNSDGPSQQSPINSTDLQEIIDESKNKLLYDWKKIYKSKAYRNDQLQNFISYQHPKLIYYYNEQVFNLAVEFIDNEALQPEAHKFNNEAIRLKEERQVALNLNIFYNKALLDRSLENYDQNELSEHFYNATEDPQLSHIHKMAMIINRYIKHVIEEILKNKIKNTDNQKIIFTQDQYKSNQLTIIETLRNIIIQNNTIPQQIYYATNQGYILVTLYEHNYLDWNKIGNALNQPQNK